MVMTSNAAVCLHPRRLCLHVSHVCVSPGRQGSLVQRYALLRKRGHAADLWHALLLRRRPRIAEFRAGICADVRSANGQCLSRTPSAVISRTTCECFFHVFRADIPLDPSSLGKEEPGQQDPGGSEISDMIFPACMIWIVWPQRPRIYNLSRGLAPFGTREHHWYVSKTRWLLMAVGHLSSAKAFDICHSRSQTCLNFKENLFNFHNCCSSFWIFVEFLHHWYLMCIWSFFY